MYTLQVHVPLTGDQFPGLSTVLREVLQVVVPEVENCSRLCGFLVAVELFFVDLSRAVVLIMESCLNRYLSGNCSQGTRAPRDQPGLRMTNTLHQSDRENLRHPASSYKYWG